MPFTPRVGHFAIAVLMVGSQVQAGSVSVSLNVLVREGASGPSGVTYGQLERPSVSATGGVAFLAEDDPTDGPDRDILVRNIGGTEILLSRVGDPSPITGETVNTIDPQPVIEGNTVAYALRTDVSTDALVTNTNGIDTVLIREGDIVQPSGQTVRGVPIDGSDIRGGQVVSEIERNPSFNEMLVEFSSSGGAPTTLIDIDLFGAPFVPGDDSEDPYLDKNGTGYVFESDVNGADSLIYADGLGNFGQLLAPDSTYSAYREPVIDALRIFVEGSKTTGGSDILSVTTAGTATKIVESGGGILPDGTTVSFVDDIAIGDGTLYFTGADSLGQGFLYSYRGSVFSRLLTDGDIVDGIQVSDVQFSLRKFGANGNYLGLRVKDQSSGDDAILLGTATIAPVPLPASLPLALIGFGVLAAIGRRRR